MDPSPVVIVKFRQKRNPADQQSSIRSLVGSDCSSIEALFPDTAEPSLATLFELRLQKEARLKDVLDKLLQNEEIEYAHTPEERRTY